jgi:cyclic-di-AMP phosphodiesterase PgpH
VDREETGPAGEDGPSRSVRKHAVGLAFAVGIAALTTALFATAPAGEVTVWEVGAVAPDNVIAPFPFVVRKSDADLSRERDEAAASITPIFRHIPEAAEASRQQLNRIEAAVVTAASRTGGNREAAVASAARSNGLTLSTEEARYLASPANSAAVFAAVRRALDRWVAPGAAGNDDLQNISGAVTVLRGRDERTADADQLPTFATVLARARSVAEELGSPQGEQLAVRLLGLVFRPTLVYDEAATEARRQQRRALIGTEQFTVRAGEKIVGAHEVVGREEHDKLRALRDAIARGEGTSDTAVRLAGWFMFNFLVIGALGVVLALFRPQFYASTRALAIIAIAYTVVIGAAAAIARSQAAAHAELVPVAFAAILFSVLFDPRISMVATVFLALLIGEQGDFAGTNAVLYGVVGGVAAAVSVRVIRRRNQALYSTLIIAVAYVLAAVAAGLTLGRPLEEMTMRAMWGTVNAVVSVAVAMTLLPVAEELSGIDTYLKLLEWSDLNRPLMQRLSMEAPGTFAHTMMIANLTEAGCNAIGANGLLGRVGAYYHDIGKLSRAQFFAENLGGARNPHDRLQPDASASIIRDHVADGLALAEEYHLPRAIRAFITEHHGTIAISYFLEKAREKKAPVAEDEFAYPGPIPQSAETAICMLADGVEAATRVLSEPSPRRIRDVVDHIVKQRLDQGQLRDAPITLSDLEIVKAEFTRVLSAMYHNRVEYPAKAGGVTSEFASA